MATQGVVPDKNRLPVLNKSGLKDLRGQTFGFLFVIQRVSSNDGKVRWRCQCVCGTRLTVRHDYLLNTNSPKRHCGCKNKRPLSFISRHIQEYHIWKLMIIRCHDSRHKTYEHYGKRGIQVCEAWRASFETFVRDLGPRPSGDHSLDRIDPDGHYEPGNVQWATAKHQARNKRKSLFLPHPQSGKMVPAAEVAEFLGLSYQVMRDRYIKEGKWPGQT